jgi:putative heme iron utilization protein
MGYGSSAPTSNRLRLVLGLLTATCVVPTHAAALSCAMTLQARNIQAYYEKLRPGVPPTVASRYFNLPEFTLTTGVKRTEAKVVRATPELVRRLWTSIDAWGAQTRVTMVFSPASKHGFEVASLVPIAKPNEGDGYLDAYSEEGKGVKAHIQVEEVAAIAAVDLPAAKEGFRTRGVTLMSSSGDVIVGVFASIKDAQFDERAVAGFNKTWQLMSEWPSACSTQAAK